jgi:hypothetical protein
MLNVTKDNKLLAFHRLSTLDYVHSQAFDSKGQFCGKMKSIVVKVSRLAINLIELNLILMFCLQPASCMHSCENCGCMFGKLEIVLWIGSDKELSEWLPQNAIEIASNKINFTVEKFHKCNIYVRQAKIQPTTDNKGLCHPKLVAVVNGMSERTRVSMAFDTCNYRRLTCACFH